MSLQLKKAHRSKAFIKIGMSAPSGGGKTFSALRLAKGLMEEKYPKMSDSEHWSKIAIIDTENGSGELYANADVGGVRIGEYNAITLEPPFEADKYTQAIELCEESGMEVCIIDSTTHLWSGTGGLLEQQSNVAKRTGNSYTAWRDITPQHNHFVEKMLQAPMHIIATMRAKQEYAVDKDDKTGKVTVRKLGLEPEQRKGMEYEFTIFFELDANHTALGAKDRTSLFDQKFFTITEDTGRTIMKWLEGGSEEPAKVIATQTKKADPGKALETLHEEVVAMCKDLGGRNNEDLMVLLGKYVENKNPNSITNVDDLVLLKSDLEMMQIKQNIKKDLVEA